MNIGIFSDTYYPQINGVATSIMLLKKELTRLGHNVYIFTPSDPNAEKKQPGIFRLPSMPFVFLPTNRMTLFYPPQFLFYIKKFKLDIIHTQTEFPLGIFGKVVSETYGIPLVHTYHTMYEDYVHYIAKGHIVSPKMAQSYSRVFCNRAKAVITPVDKSKEKLKSYGVKRPIFVAPTGIDFEPFSRNNFSHNDIVATKAELGVNETDPIMLSIGRIAKEKSIDVLINEMPKVLEQIPNMKFIIIGDGPYKKNLEELTKTLNIEDSVIFPGSRPWSEIGKYYQVGDVFVCASTSETQGLTYVEAMAAGVPVIAKKDPSVAGVIEDGVTGFYFYDDEDAADIISKAMSNPDKLKEISAEALKAIEPFSLEHFGRNIENVYEKVIQMDIQDRLDKKDKSIRNRVGKTLSKTKNLVKITSITPNKTTDQKNSLSRKLFKVTKKDEDES